MKRGGGMPSGMANLMRQANQMQSKIKKLQEELATREHEGTSGGGAVSVKVKGEHEIIAIENQRSALLCERYDHAFGHNSRIRIIKRHIEMNRFNTPKRWRIVGKADGVRQIAAH